MKQWWRVGIRVFVAVSVLAWLPLAHAQDPELPEPPVIVDDPEDPEEPDPEPPEDDTTGPHVDPQRITDLAERFDVDESTVTDMRTGGMGWGEIDLCLRLAENVAGESGDINATLSDLRAARAEGRGWGEIAADYDLKIGQMKKLAPVEGPVDTDPEPESEPSLERVQRRERHRVEGPDVIDKPSKPDKPVKPDKPEKPERPDKPNKPEKPDKPAKIDKPDKPDKPEKPEKGKP